MSASRNEEGAANGFIMVDGDAIPKSRSQNNKKRGRPRVEQQDKNSVDVSLQIFSLHNCVNLNTSLRGSTIFT